MYKQWRLFRPSECAPLSQEVPHPHLSTEPLRLLTRLPNIVPNVKPEPALLNETTLVYRVRQIKVIPCHVLLISSTRLFLIYIYI